MTTAVMEPDPADQSASGRTIVLLLNCPGVQKYLNDSNKVLTALHGQPLLRIEANLERWFITQEEAYRNVVKHLEQHDITLKEMRKNIGSRHWLAEVTRTRVTAGLQKILRQRKIELTEYDVRLVFLAEQDVMAKGSVLEEALLPLFVGAHFFSINPEDSNQRPTPIWQEQRTVAMAPLCDNCQQKMRPAGSTYVCEGCGSVKGLT